MSEVRSDIYLAGLSDDSEISRGIQIALLGLRIEELQAATFSGPATEDGWAAWIRDVLKPVILPGFIAIYQATASTHHAEIAELDKALTEELPPDMAEKSIAASTPFRDSKNEVRHMAQWVRFEEKLQRGESPGHLATLFAIQSALFNIPVFTAVISYACAEWIGANPHNRLVPDFVYSAILPLNSEIAVSPLHSI